MRLLFDDWNLIIGDYLKYCLLIGTWLLIILLAPSAAFAGTDPKTSSPYATASIPALAALGDTQAPSIPILIRPEGSTITSDNTPEYVWNGSTDPNGNTVLYTLYRDSVATYLGISNLGNSAGVGYTARLEAGDLYLTPSSALPDGTYHWHVTASDLSGNASQSTIWGFTIDTLAPKLSVVDLDTYHEPVITEGANFDIDGPKDIYFTVLSDPFITIQVSLSSPESNVYHLTSNTNSAGLATFHLNLALGTHSLALLAIDGAMNTTTLPDFTLTLNQAAITLPLPALPGLPPSLSLPYTPYSPTALTATIAQLSSPSYRLASIIYILLSLGIIGLLIILKRRRFNLILFDSALRPLHHATIYHSWVHTPGVKGSHTPGVLFLYHLTPADHGRLYIPHLGRYSTLTIRLQTKQLCTVYVLSICAKQRVYTLVLG